MNSTEFGHFELPDDFKVELKILINNFLFDESTHLRIELWNDNSFLHVEHEDGRKYDVTIPMVICDSVFSENGTPTLESELAKIRMIQKLTDTEALMAIAANFISTESFLRCSEGTSPLYLVPFDYGEEKLRKASEEEVSKLIDGKPWYKFSDIMGSWEYTGGKFLESTWQWAKKQNITDDMTVTFKHLFPNLISRSSGHTKNTKRFLPLGLQGNFEAPMNWTLDGKTVILNNQDQAKAMFLLYYYGTPISERDICKIIDYKGTLRLRDLFKMIPEYPRMIRPLKSRRGIFQIAASVRPQ